MSLNTWPHTRTGPTHYGVQCTRVIIFNILLLLIKISQSFLNIKGQEVESFPSFYKSNVYILREHLSEIKRYFRVIHVIIISIDIFLLISWSLLLFSPNIITPSKARQNVKVQTVSIINFPIKYSFVNPFTSVHSDKIKVVSLNREKM